MTPTLNSIAYDHQIFNLQQFGGISRYFCEIGSRISRDPAWRARVIAPIHFNDHLADSSVPRVGMRLRMRVPRTGRLYRAANALLGPLLVSAFRPDIVHRTYYAARSVRQRAHVVVTVFDMIHELFPQYFPSDDPVQERKRRCVETADQVICISRSTADDLQRLLGVPAHKITVTHLGFSDAFVQDHTNVSDRPRGRPYLLYVGHRSGYKNFARVLEAFAGSSRLRADFDLVAFGGFPFNADELARIRALGLSPATVRRETGSDEDLARAYSGARAFVYPSEYEGFGIPPLEAMSCGCAVACSDSSSMPEVVGDAGEYFSPTNIDAIRAALERLAYDDNRRRSLIAAGHLQCQRFTWDRCAEETLAVYRKALGTYG